MIIKGAIVIFLKMNFHSVLSYLFIASIEKLDSRIFHSATCFQYTRAKCITASLMRHHFEVSVTTASETQSSVLRRIQNGNSLFNA